MAVIRRKQSQGQKAKRALLIELLDSVNWTVTECAKKLDVSRGTVSRWVNGREPISDSRLKSVINAVDIETAEREIAGLM